MNAMNDANPKTKVNCHDRERIFEDGRRDEWIALEAHALTCTECAEEIRAWKSLSVAATELRDYSDDPSLWPRIHRSLSKKLPKLSRASHVGLGNPFGGAFLIPGKRPRQQRWYLFWLCPPRFIITTI